MLTITKGDNKLVSPYTGADPLEISLTNGKPNAWYELIVPTNTVTTSVNGTEVTTEHSSGVEGDPTNGWRQADGSGNAKFLFNSSPTDGTVERTALYGWILPPGIYQFAVREFYNTVPLETIDIEITSEATTAIQTATASVKKARGKK